MRVTTVSVVADRGRSNEDVVGATTTSVTGAQKWVTTGVPIGAKS